MENVMLNDIADVFFSEKQLDEITTRIAAQISEDYKDKKLTLVCVLKGSVMFMSDLMKKISIPCSVDFLAAESYGSSTRSSGDVKITKDLSDNVKDRDILIVEDILDSGRTLKKLTEFLAMKDPASITICTLLDKPSRRAVEIEAKYIGSQVQDEFVVGYGLDYDQHYRNLPFIGILKPEAAERIANSKE